MVSNGCGGAQDCGACGANEACGAVVANRCGPLPCFNGVRDGPEGDVDCGGSCAAFCAIGRLCNVTADCVGNASCTMGVCTRGRAVALEAMPQGRGNAASVVVDGRLYVFGGLDSSLEPTTSTYIFDGTSWSGGAPFPEPRQMATAVALAGGKIALVSGRGPSSTDHPDAGVRRRVDVYEPSSNSWSRLPDLPTSHVGACLVARPNDELLVIGGYTGSDDDTQTRSVARWTPDAGQWVEVPDALLVPRGGATCGPTADGGVLLAGGLAAGFIYATDTAELLNPSSLTSVLLPRLPVRRGLSTAGVLPDGRVLLLGGWDATSTVTRSGAAMAESWLWSERAPLGEAMTPLPARLYGTASGLGPDGGLWLAGGVEKVTNLLFPRVSSVTTSWSY